MRGGHGVSEHGVTGGRRGLGRGRLLRGYGGVGPLTAAGLFAQLSEVLYGTPVVSVYLKSIGIQSNKLRRVKGVDSEMVEK